MIKSISVSVKKFIIDKFSDKSDFDNLCRSLDINNHFDGNYPNKITDLIYKLEKGCKNPVDKLHKEVLKLKPGFKEDIDKLFDVKVKSDESLYLLEGNKSNRDNDLVELSKENELLNKVYALGESAREFLSETLSSCSILEKEDISEAIKRIDNTLSKLNNREYKVAVIAAMKAGKSTFLNSIIGADVLASDNDACTVASTIIKNCTLGDERLSVKWKGEKEEILVKGDSVAIKKKFQEFTQKVRDNGKVKKIDEIVLYYPIKSLAGSPAMLKGFSFIDTPGYNEMENTKFKVSALKEQVLRNLRTSNVVIFLLDYRSFRDNTNEELLKAIPEDRLKQLQKEPEKLIFVVNKIDEVSRENVKKSIDDIVNDIRGILKSYNFMNPLVYTISASKALYGGIIVEVKKRLDSAKTIEDKKIIKEDAEKYKNLLMDRHSAEYRQEDEKWGETTTPDPFKVAELSLKDSGLLELEAMVLKSIFQKSGIRLLEDCVISFNNTIIGVENSARVAIKSLEEDYNKMKNDFLEIKDEVINIKDKLRNIEDRFKKKEKKIRDRIENELVSFYKNAEELLRVRLLKEDMSSLNKGNSFFDKMIYKIINNPIINDFLRIGIDNQDAITEDENNRRQKLIYTAYYECFVLVSDARVDFYDYLARLGEEEHKKVVFDIQSSFQTISDSIAKFIKEKLEITYKPVKINIPFDEKPIDSTLNEIIEQEHKAKVKIKKTSKRDEERGWCLFKDVVTVEYEDVIEVDGVDYNPDKMFFVLKKKLRLGLKESSRLANKAILEIIKAELQRGRAQLDYYIKKINEFDCRLEESNKMSESEKEKSSNFLMRLVKELDDIKEEKIKHIKELIEETINLSV